MICRRAVSQLHWTKWESPLCPAVPVGGKPQFTFVKDVHDEDVGQNVAGPGVGCWLLPLSLSLSLSLLLPLPLLATHLENNPPTRAVECTLTRLCVV
jgi:hypothetical protein